MHNYTGTNMMHSGMKETQNTTINMNLKTAKCIADDLQDFIDNKVPMRKDTLARLEYLIKKIKEAEPDLKF